MSKNNRIAQLELVVKQMLQPLKGLPFDLVIESLSGGNKILSYKQQHLSLLKKSMDLAVEKINKKGIVSKRVNEVGNYIEKFVIDAFNECKVNASIPETKKGNKKSTGYPDVYVKIKKTNFYIECKTYNDKNKDTTFRSFYLSPSDDFKITKDAFHLIFAFSIEKEANVFKVKSGKILDTKDLLLNVKYEFNASNKDMYGENGLKVLYNKNYSEKK